jgi:hypothetical protein
LFGWLLDVVLCGFGALRYFGGWSSRFGGLVQALSQVFQCSVNDQVCIFVKLLGLRRHHACIWLHGQQRAEVDHREFLACHDCILTVLVIAVIACQRLGLAV